MTTTFGDRMALEEAIQSCSISVRTLQKKMHNKNEDMDVVAKEVSRLVRLRKELHDWTEKEDKLQKEMTPETIVEDKLQKEMTREIIDEDEPVKLADELEQRSAMLESRVALMNDGLTTIEMDVMRMERTKRALRYLEEHKTTGEGSKDAVFKSEDEPKTVMNAKKSRRRNNKVKEDVKTKGAIVDSEADSNAVDKLIVQLEAERRKVVEANEETESFKNSLTRLSNENSVVVAKLTAELNVERVKADQALQKSLEVQKVEEEFRQVQAKLEQDVAKIQQEKADIVAKLTMELEAVQQTIQQGRQSRSIATSELEKAVGLLTEKNAELMRKLATAEETARTVCDEFQDKLQAAEDATKAASIKAEDFQKELLKIQNVRETRETHLGKLWKTIEDLQLANKRMTKKSASIEADAKAMRAEAEGTIAKYTSLTNKANTYAAELKSATVELEASKAKVVTLEAKVQELATELNVSRQDVVTSNERLQTMEKELMTAKLAVKTLTIELDTLRTSKMEAKNSNDRIESLEKKLELTKQVKNKLMVEEKKAQAVAKAAIADKEQVARKMNEMKATVVQLKLECDKATAQASESNVQLKKVTMDLKTRSTEAKKLKSQYDNLVSQRTTAADQLQDMRGVAATNEEMLKKSRASLLEANVELKEARANTLKWKNSAQAAKTLMNAKIADFESARKQLKKARAEATSSSLARSQVSLSLEAKKKRLAQTKQELATVRAELARAREAIVADRKQLGETHEAHVAQLSDSFEQEIATLESQVQSYSMALVILLPLVIAVVVFALVQLVPFSFDK
ncbi:hypothetical protein CCR75_004162 [Bremia lactucae]|uniref:Uncharacterized protein n=1 Tax=Bremia lactucae TaxID=4779 RepID=A0A976IEG8_BRELC|nr:hypothetical protein CCR75_004162 [Bremia lactucae]